ncbi:hypothetical protein CAC42_4340 [Sphaceloma murrayae]|uniref:Acyltransferase 3 domain-containing protein n=1 Tax=Sphaceloma murrayae TaxID=2082308 RepID=A0A2K1QM43_9PEZI|nr:hypothetical protein CAC42_4340 [Sphaceloma murrayae]
MVEIQDDMAMVEKSEDIEVQPARRRRLAAFQSSTLFQTLLWTVQSLRPSFMSTCKRNNRLRRTAYLDGIRGFAAFLVYWHHHELWAHEAQQSDERLQSSFGWKGEHILVTAPFIRTFVTGGHFAVAIFLIISGYVLSTKPLSLLESGDHLAFADNVASALFRRWFRLWIPIFVMSIGIVSLYYWTGIFANFIPEGSYGKELWKLYGEMKVYSFVFGQPKMPWLSYHPHTWTIPVELRGSFLIYGTLIALSRATRKARLWCMTGLIFYFMWITDGAFYAMFIAGMLICNLDMPVVQDELAERFTFLKPFETVIWYVVLIVGLYLSGVPSAANDVNYLRDSPGWYYLSYLKPAAVFDQKWFFLFWAAIMIITAIARIHWLRRFFETGFCQYLGRISYMLYLFHGPILWTLGDRLYAATGWSRESHALHLPGWTNRLPVPKFGPLGLELAFFVPNLILVPVTFWFAEIGTTLIDGPALRFGSWLYGKVKASDEYLA